MSPIRHKNGQGGGAAAKDFFLPTVDRFRKQVEQEVSLHPAIGLAVAAACGLLIGLWIKRR